MRKRLIQACFFLSFVWIFRARKFLWRPYYSDPSFSIYTDSSSLLPSLSLLALSFFRLTHPKVQQCVHLLSAILCVHCQLKNDVVLVLPIRWLLKFAAQSILLFLFLFFFLINGFGARGFGGTTWTIDENYLYTPVRPGSCSAIIWIKDRLQGFW